MCLLKTSKKLRTTEDLYVLKSGCFNERTFGCEYRNFIYTKGVKYKKSYLTELFANLNRYLSNEVFHTYDIQESKDRIYNPDSFEYSHVEYGIFKIPAGTSYYTGAEGELGAFAIEYIGPLTEENSHLITDQN